MPGARELLPVLSLSKSTAPFVSGPLFTGGAVSKALM